MPEAHALLLGLVGDIGGTNARFALADAIDGRVRLHCVETLACRDHASVEDAVTAYLDHCRPPFRPRQAAIAVAGPIKDGAIAFTNLGWSASEKTLGERLGARASLLNDYAALALSCGHLPGADLHRLGPPVDGTPPATLAVMGPGTGFGVAALVRDGRSETVLTGEGGHGAFAPVDDLEGEICKILRRRFGRVSTERVLSGPGLSNLFAAMAEISGVSEPCPLAAEITRRAEQGDSFSRRVIERFCAILGSTAGDLALVYGAQGGLFLAGGIAPKILHFLENSEFRQHFQSKGRFEGYLRRIPTWVVLHPYAALLGAARLLRPTAEA